MIRAVLVDDQVLFLESLKRVLREDAPDIDIVGVAYNGKEAIEVIADTNPDVVVMDIRMPIMDGVEAVRILRERFPTVRILVLTTFDDDDYVYDALNYGAHGYLLKDIAPSELIRDIRLAVAGPIQISPAIVAKLIARKLETQDADISNQPSWIAELNEKEKQILRLIIKGMDNSEIAAAQFLATQTVKNYTSIIYAKMGARNRAHAISKAVLAQFK